MKSEEKSDQFSLEHQFRLYLYHAGLIGKEMSVIQYQETKRAFFGACGQMLILMRDGITELNDDDGVDVLQNLIEQVSDFWQNELYRKN